MIYLATPSSDLIKLKIQDRTIGQLVTPNSGNKLVEGAIWGLDNGCYSANWSQEKWLRTLERYTGEQDCRFAVVPDVVGDSVATDLLWDEWASIVKQLGFAAAYVTQNGCEEIPLNADALFTGGDDAWKLGTKAQELVLEAKRRGIWCHMGRVNSRKRVRYATSCGYDSVDGTYLAFAPNQNLPKLLSWMREATTQGVLI